MMGLYSTYLAHSCCILRLFLGVMQHVKVLTVKILVYNRRCVRKAGPIEEGHVTAFSYAHSSLALVEEGYS